jgi:ssDNA-binding Zn-finger/Zn-ribbon topoisomerase 1
MLEFLIGAAVAFVAGSLLKNNSDNNRPIKNITPRSTRKTDKDSFDQIKSRNLQITDLQNKAKKDGSLNENEKNKIITLEQDRERIFKDYQNQKQSDVLARAENESEKFKLFNISQDKIHLIQYHVGETVLGKTCYKCGKPMILQFPREKEICDPNDFFWACTGWYYKQCNITQPFTIADLSLFTENNKNEFHIKNDELSLIFNEKSIQQHTLKRVDAHRNQSVDKYVCPFHKEPLVLRRKNEAGGALDTFFLGCPQWVSANCTYVLKLKSPAQLASFLQKTEDCGIL